MKNNLLAVLLILTCTFYAQEWVTKMQDPKGNFYDVKASFDEYWKTHDKTEKGKGYKVFKRWEHFVESRVYPSGDLSLLGLTAKNYETFLNNYQTPTNSPGKQLGGNNNLIASATWTPIGPMGAISGSAGSQLLKSGRINFITITPGNLTTLWIGAPAGGLWKSTNGGVSWTTNTDNLGVIGCSDLAIDPTNTLVMYLATGDGDAGDTRSIGVLKSIDGGVTWAPTGLTNPVTTNFTIRRLIINPSNTQILMAATSSGIYRTVNGGTNWTQVITNNTYDLEFKPTDPNTVYAAGTSFRRSTNGGASWTQITSGITTTGVNRMAIAVTPDDVNYVYVLASNSTGSGFQGLYRSTASGSVFTQMSTTPNVLGWSSTGSDTDGQGWYDLCIAASPLDKNEIVVGGVNVWRSLDGGSAWSIYGHWVGSGAPFTHADQHDLEFDATGTLYDTNDGTVYRRTGSTWTEISGTINISQIYRIGMSSLAANRWITGHQDNGTSIWNGIAYQATLGGDGMDCFFDRTNNSNVFGEYQNGGMQRSTNGGNSWSGAASGMTGTAPWLTIWKQDPVTATRLYCGWDNLFVSNNLAVSWSSLTALPATGGIREFAIASSNNQIIYVLKSAGIYKSINGGSTWTTITGIVPVSSANPEYICVDPTDANNAWVVLSGYSSGNKVYVTYNGGTSWTNYSSNLPNIPANCIVYQPGTNDVVYVGMDVGVYYRSASSSTWTLYNASLPNVPISELEISPASPNLLHAATYGRGVWVASVYSAPAPPASNFSLTSTAVCKSSAITFADLSTNTPTAWLWSVNPAVGVTITSSTSQNPTITFPNAGTYTVSMVATSAFGSGNTYTQSVVVSGPPNITISVPTKTTCPGAQVSFTASGASSYVWGNAGGSSSIGIYTPTANTTYTLTGSTNGCTATKTLSAVMLPIPSIQISGPSAICSGDLGQLSASGAQSYTWSNSFSIGTISINPLTTTVYSVSGTGSNGCNASAFYTVTVNALPQINISSNDTLICAGDEITLSGDGGVFYAWSPGQLSGNSVVTSPATSVDFTCTGTDANGCNNSAVLSVTVDICESITQHIKFEGKELAIYPNPAKAKLIVQSFESMQQSLFLEIVDVSGKLVYKQTLEFNTSTNISEVNISSLASGNYFVSVNSSSQKSTLIKIIKE
jgi:hypothetical protein